MFVWLYSRIIFTRSWMCLCSLPQLSHFAGWGFGVTHLKIELKAGWTRRLTKWHMCYTKWFQVKWAEMLCLLYIAFLPSRLTCLENLETSYDLILECLHDDHLWTTSSQFVQYKSSAFFLTEKNEDASECRHCFQKAWDGIAKQLGILVPSFNAWCSKC